MINTRVVILSCLCVASSFLIYQVFHSVSDNSDTTTMGFNSKLVSVINRIIQGYFPKKITKSQVSKRVSSSEKESIFINKNLRIPCDENECELSISYRTPCKCVNKMMDALADKFKDPRKFPQNEQSISKSFNEYAKNTLLIEDVSPTDENIEIIRNASLYAETLNLQNFSLNHLLEIHRLVMIKNDQLAGIIRDQDVVIRLPDEGSVMRFRKTPSPHELEKHLKDYFEWFKSEINSQTNALVFAAMAKYYFVTIHPFGDGNGRTSRVILNTILRKFMPCWVTIPVAEIETYYAVLGIVQESKNVNPYLAYITECIRRSLDDYTQDATRM
ncbi:protein adenylyltransferase Fic-like [Planococcus citri]|uniref:protein adenylyltransferase Fic-like n=1 Tax=Planococcus citri TaxID=170843 RepID=UPI0031F72FC6